MAPDGSCQSVGKKLTAQTGMGHGCKKGHMRRSETCRKPSRRERRDGTTSALAEIGRTAVWILCTGSESIRWGTERPLPISRCLKNRREVAAGAGGKPDRAVQTARSVEASARDRRRRDCAVPQLASPGTDYRLRGTVGEFARAFAVSPGLAPEHDAGRPLSGFARSGSRSTARITGKGRPHPTAGTPAAPPSRSSR